MLFIHGVGHFHPENIIDNRLLESLDIGTTDEWILAHTGIRRRHTVLPLAYITETRNRDPRGADESSIYSNAETGALAAGMALERCGLNASDIGMVIAGSSAPRMSCPAEACLIADRLGISAPAFDLNSACSTFAAQMRMLSLMDADALPEFVLVVNPENLTRVVNYDCRNDAVLFGDCATAAVVSRKVPARAILTRSLLASDPANWRKVIIPSAGHFSQDGPAVQSFAIRTTMSIIQQLRRFSAEEPYFIGHQANLVMLKSVCSRSGISVQRHLFNVDMYGNCGTAGAPSVLSERWDQFGPGDELVIAVVGGGLTWAGLMIEFVDLELKNSAEAPIRPASIAGPIDVDDHR